MKRVTHKLSSNSNDYIVLQAIIEKVPKYNAVVRLSRRTGLSHREVINSLERLDEGSFIVWDYVHDVDRNPESDRVILMSSAQGKRMRDIELEVEIHG